MQCAISFCYKCRVHTRLRNSLRVVPLQASFHFPSNQLMLPFMTSLNYIPNKTYRNRLSLFLQLSALRKSSQPGISSDSWFATTPTTSGVTEPVSPTSALTVHNLPILSSSRTASPLVHSPMQTEFPGDSVPPTVNELDAQEKAKLLKKHRKLSRVFGEVPDFQLPSTRTRSTSSHRRSASTHTNNSDVSLRRRTPRKFASQSDLGSSSDSASRLDESDRYAIPPVPSLTLPHRDSIDAFSEPIPAQHRKNSLYILTPPKSLSDDDYTINYPASPTSNIPDSVRKQRMAKPHLGHQNSSPTLNTRKSYDSSIVNETDEVVGKPLHRSRSLTPHQKVLDDTDSAVEFHRQYVQTFRKVDWRPIPEGNNESIDASSSQTPDTNTYPISVGTVASPQDTDAPPGSDTAIPASPSSASIHSVDSLFSESAFDQNFRERRRRAAKLAQFFGVQYQDISASLPGVPDYLSEPVHSTVGDPYSEPLVQSSARIEPTVDIRTNTRRFWGFNGENLKEADVNDVIHKLRELKAT